MSHAKKLTAAALAAAALLVGGYALAQDSTLPILDEDDPMRGRKAWLVRMSRMEGAAGNVKESAQQLREVTERIGESGRLEGVAEVIGSGEELNRRVQSAVLAAEVLDKRL